MLLRRLTRLPHGPAAAAAAAATRASSSSAAAAAAASSSSSALDRYAAARPALPRAPREAVVAPRGNGRVDLERTVRAVRDYGFVIIPGLYTGASLDALAAQFIGRTDRVLDDLGAWARDDAGGAGDPIAVGSAHGFHEVCLRSPGRYDVSSSFDDFAPEHLAPIEAVMSRVLGDDHVPAFCGVVYSEPGSSDQQWHADSLHLYESHGEANLVNGLVALHDIRYELGPTEFAPCSHYLTNHLTNPKVDGTNIVYQTPANLNEPMLVGADPVHNLCLELPAGTVVLFDDRTLHRGRGNDSADDARYVGYFSYRRPWYHPDTHFEATRSLYDTRENGGVVLSTTTRAATGAAVETVAETAAETTEADTADHFCLARQVRDGFPALADHAPAIFADGAGGSQVHETVIAAVAEQMRRGAANLGGYYPTSERCMDTTRAARAAAADLLNCRDDEITFGNNMTTLVYHLGHALFAPSATGVRLVGPGDNVVLSRLEHDANAGPWERLAREVAGCEVRWVPLAGPDGKLDMEALEGLVDARTKFVACGAASNSLGTINDIQRVCAAARAVGALSFVDAVHYAPHDVIDVQDIGCDFLACSPYKFFGPHSGLLYGRAALMGDNNVMRPFKIRTSEDALPSDASYQISKWELGTQNFEALAGITACVDYVADVGRRFGPSSRARSDGGGSGGSSSARRVFVEAGWDAIRAHENGLKTRFLRGAQQISGLEVYGVSDLARVHERTATFAVGFQGVDPDALTRALTGQGVFCTSGNHYCTFWERDLGARHGLDDVRGATRIGFLHYNTADEVDRVLEALERERAQHGCK